MTKSEKRYFRLQNAGQPDDRGFMKLYNVLEAATGDGQELFACLPSLFPGTTIEPARKHLYRVIMRTLRQFEADKNVETKLFNLLQDSKILLNRGFIEASAQTLAKAKDTALKNEKFTYFILLARQELRLETYRQYAGTSESDLIAKQEAVTRLLQHEISSHQHHSIYEVLHLRYWKGKTISTLQEQASLNDLLLEEHHILTSQSLESFEARQIHLLFQSTFMLMTGDSAGSLNTLYGLDELFLEHKHLWVGNPIYYIHTLNGILHTLRRMEEYEQMFFFIGRLGSIELNSENMQLSVKSQVLEHKLHAGLGLGLFSECKELLQNEAFVLDKLIEQISLYEQGQLLLTISRFWFMNKNYSKALHYINKILNNTGLLRHKGLHVKCALTYLMIHKSLNNKELLIYEVRSYERKLKKEGATYQSEKLTISLLKHWIKGKSTHHFSQALLQFSEDPLEQILISELGLKDWFRDHSQ